MTDVGPDRREFLAGAAGTGVVLISSVALGAGVAAKAEDKAEKGEDIPPTEDLMREHGVLRRILLVYDEAARRLATDDALVVGVIASAAGLVRRFVESYHEKLEEEFVLPKLEKAGKLVDLAKVIRLQHTAGRKLTESILSGTKTGTKTGAKTGTMTGTAGKAASAEQRRAIVTDMQSFARMYAAHTAWEDTELFPVYRAQFTEAELDKLGEKFEEQEHKLLGASGFEGALREVGDLEKTLGIHDLAHFTPR
jgi:hemerythrin-like domain-containing protein